MIGFVFTRHVNSQETNNYWIEAYSCIRRHYPQNTILIIDDNSNYAYVKQPEDLKLTNCFIIQSEYPQRGELLSYYYFYKYNLFDKAVILHDSTFLQQPVDFDAVEDIKFMWHFYHDWDDTTQEKALIKSCLTNPESVTLLYDEKDKWYGAFGVQSTITRTFLTKIVETFNIFDLFKNVDTRPKRMAIERIFGLLCAFIKPELADDPSLFGTIHGYCKWGYSYNQYKNDSKPNLPIIKVWSSR